jgi:hypothetical protein
MLDAGTTAALSRRPTIAPLAGLLAFVLVLAALGAYLAVGIVGGDEHSGTLVQREPNAGFAVGDSVYTSFGAVAVEAVQKHHGLSAKDLSGMTHGIKNFVGADKVQVQTFATMTNLTGKPVHYDPRWFSLAVGRKDGKTQGPFGASVKAGTLQPNAAIDVRLTFVVPRKGQHLWVRFRDPARATPFSIDLGRVTKTRQGPLANQHVHPSK